MKREEDLRKGRMAEIVEKDKCSEDLDQDQSMREMTCGDSKEKLYGGLSAEDSRKACNSISLPQ